MLDIGITEREAASPVPSLLPKLSMSILDLYFNFLATSAHRLSLTGLVTDMKSILMSDSDISTNRRGDTRQYENEKTDGVSDRGKGGKKGYARAMANVSSLRAHTKLRAPAGPKALIMNLVKSNVRFD